MNFFRRFIQIFMKDLFLMVFIPLLKLILDVWECGLVVECLHSMLRALNPQHRGFGELFWAQLLSYGFNAVFTDFCSGFYLLFSAYVVFCFFSLIMCRTSIGYWFQSFTAIHFYMQYWQWLSTDVTWKNGVQETHEKGNFVESWGFIENQKRINLGEGKLKIFVYQW